MPQRCPRGAPEVHSVLGAYVSTQHEAALSAASRIQGPRSSLQGSGSTSNTGRVTLTGRLQTSQQGPELGQRSDWTLSMPGPGGSWLGN